MEESQPRKWQPPPARDVLDALCVAVCAAVVVQSVLEWLPSPYASASAPGLTQTSLGGEPAAVAAVTVDADGKPRVTAYGLDDEQRVACKTALERLPWKPATAFGFGKASTVEVACEHPKTTAPTAKVARSAEVGTIRQALRKGRPHLQRCYEERLKLGGHPLAHMQAEFTIDTSGAMALALHRISSSDDAYFTQCIRDYFNKLRADPPPKATHTASAPFIFLGSGAWHLALPEQPTASSPAAPRESE
jgi:hypothetical protein